MSDPDVNDDADSEGPVEASGLWQQILQAIVALLRLSNNGDQNRGVDE